MPEKLDDLQLDKIVGGVGSESRYITHVVVDGDTLGKLAKRYHTTAEAILVANPALKNKNMLIKGMEIKIPYNF